LWKNTIRQIIDFFDHSMVHDVRSNATIAAKFRPADAVVGIGSKNQLQNILLISTLGVAI
jgi:hypothetical protein